MDCTDTSAVATFLLFRGVVRCRILVELSNCLFLLSPLFVCEQDVGTDLRLLCSLEQS